MFRMLQVSVQSVATILATTALFAAAAGTVQPETADEAALRDAAWDGKSDEVERLLDKGTDPNVPNHKGWTTVHHAGDRADAAMLEVLLEAGGNPNLQDVEGRTVDRILAAMLAEDPRPTNQPAFYVAISKARDAAQLVTDDAHRLATSSNA